jgi:hypothetical protein
LRGSRCGCVCVARVAGGSGVREELLAGRGRARVGPVPLAGQRRQPLLELLQGQGVLGLLLGALRGKHGLPLLG